MQVNQRRSAYCLVVFLCSGNGIYDILITGLLSVPSQLRNHFVAMQPVKPYKHVLTVTAFNHLPAIITEKLPCSIITVDKKIRYLVLRIHQIILEHIITYKIPVKNEFGIRSGNTVIYGLIQEHFFIETHSYRIYDIGSVKSGVINYYRIAVWCNLVLLSGDINKRAFIRIFSFRTEIVYLFIFPLLECKEVCPCGFLSANNYHGTLVYPSKFTVSG